MFQSLCSGTDRSGSPASQRGSRTEKKLLVCEGLVGDVEQTVELVLGAAQVGIEALQRLDDHLYRGLQHTAGELFARHGGQPQAKVFVHGVTGQALTDSSSCSQERYKGQFCNTHALQWPLRLSSRP